MYSLRNQKAYVIAFLCLMCLGSVFATDNSTKGIHVTGTAPGGAVLVTGTYYPRPGFPGIWDRHDGGASIFHGQDGTGEMPQILREVWIISDGVNHNQCAFGNADNDPCSHPLVWALEFSPAFIWVRATCEWEYFDAGAPPGFNFPTDMYVQYKDGHWDTVPSQGPFGRPPPAGEDKSKGYWQEQPDGTWKWKHYDDSPVVPPSDPSTNAPDWNKDFDAKDTLDPFAGVIANTNFEFDMGYINEASNFNVLVGVQTTQTLFKIDAIMPSLSQLVMWDFPAVGQETIYQINIPGLFHQGEQVSLRLDMDQFGSRYELRVLLLMLLWFWFSFRVAALVRGAIA